MTRTDTIHTTARGRIGDSSPVFAAVFVTDLVVELLPVFVVVVLLLVL